MNRRSTSFVPRVACALCLLLVAGQAARSNAQSYEGYPVFWGKQNSLQQPTAKAKSASGSARDQHASSLNDQIKQVGYTERQTADRVAYEKAPSKTIIQGDILDEGEVIVDGSYDDGGYGGECSSCGGAGCDACGGVGGGCLEGALQRLLSRSELYFGVQAFKGPLDNDENGNFGFQQGFNIGFPLLPSYGIGAQFGANFTQSDLSGYEVQDFYTDSARTQQFITVGVFERATECCPLQWGLVFDWMNDDLAAGFELSQLRGEIGYLFSQTGEVGFWFTASDDTDQTHYFGNNGHFFAGVEPIDMYALYYRHTTCDGNELRFWGGLTENSDGIFGTDFQVPFCDQFAIRGAANYIVGSGEECSCDAHNESWGIGFSLVWYPGCRARCVSSDLYAPLLRVADNTTFMVDDLHLPH